MMTFKEFQAVAAFCIEVYSGPSPSHLRKGQILVNLLSRIRPGMARDMTADQPFDCFYSNNKIPAFWAWVEKNWNENTTESYTDPAGL